MKADISKTERRIEQAMGVIQNIRRATNGWDDEVGEEFRNVLNDISKSCENPKERLHDAQPKLENLAQIVDKYSQLRFK